MTDIKAAITKKAVMFDMDGTLLDTLVGITKLLNKALSDMHFPEHTLEEYRKLVGGGIKGLVRDCIPEKRRNTETVKKCLDIVFQHYDAYYDVGTKIYPGINELLKKLKEQGYKLAVLSNRPDKYTQQLVANYFPKDMFDAVSGEVKEVPRKPDPESAKIMADKLNVKTEEIIFLGDTDIDMQTANSAGMLAVGVSWGFRDRAELLANGADVVIDHPMDLFNNIR